MSDGDASGTGGSPVPTEGAAASDAGGSPPAARAEIVPATPPDATAPGHSTALRVADNAPTAWMASPEQFQSFRELRTQLLQRGEQQRRDHFTTMVVPMTSACGGSFVARNLAAAFTLQQRPSLLIECNFDASPEGDGLLAEPDPMGLLDFLSNADDPTAVLPLWPTAIRGLTVIPRGRLNPLLGMAQREQLSSPPMKELMARVRTWPCHVFVDAPPIEGSPDAQILASLVDVIVLVVGYGRATPRAIARAASMFEPSKLAGAVFNEYTRPPQPRPPR